MLEKMGSELNDKHGKAITKAPKLDIEEIASISLNQLAEKQDELWLLQTDLDLSVWAHIRFHRKILLT